MGSNTFKKIYTIFTIIVLLTFKLTAQEHDKIDTNGLSDTQDQQEKSDQNINTKNIKRHVVRENISTKEKFAALGLVYTVQWTYYLTGQYSNIQENGSFENWHQNMSKLHFDKDSYDYNLILHTMTGNYYYLFYRSRGYSKPGALGWSIISQALFEFTIETATEPPSIQDLYQTPVLGTLVGMGVERLSLHMINSQYRIIHYAGYLFNPFAAFDFSYYKVSTIPEVSADRVGVGVSVDF